VEDSLKNLKKKESPESLPKLRSIAKNLQAYLKDRKGLDFDFFMKDFELIVSLTAKTITINVAYIDDVGDVDDNVVNVHWSDQRPLE